MRSRNKLCKRFWIALYGWYQYENNSSIAWNCEFKGVPCLPHGPKSIFVAGAAKIGKNCVIFQQVTIGSNTIPGSKGVGAPQIGDNCYIGAGAKIIGNVRIGNNVRIGANAVVFKNVPENAVVFAPEPSMIVKDAAPDNRFYSWGGKWMYFDNGRWIPVSDENASNSLNGKRAD
jgi:serine O-acetyltransferase